VVGFRHGDEPFLPLPARLALEAQLDGQLVEELALRVGQAGRKFGLYLVFVLPKVHEDLGEPDSCFFRDGVGIGSLLAILLRVGNKWLAGFTTGISIVVPWVVALAITVVVIVIVIVAASSSTASATATTPSSTSSPATASSAFPSSSTTTSAVDVVPRAAPTAVVVAHDDANNRDPQSLTSKLSFYAYQQFAAIRYSFVCLFGMSKMMCVCSIYQLFPKVIFSDNIQYWNSTIDSNRTDFRQKLKTCLRYSNMLFS
jgi:hypothetical protein